MNEMVRMMNEKIDKIFDCFMENGASDAEIYALIKLMDDKSKKMIDEHLDMVGVYDRVIKKTCPKCGEIMYSEGINNGIGYCHPPFHCECGWSEMCGYQDKDVCEECGQYEFCYRT